MRRFGIMAILAVVSAGCFTDRTEFPSGELRCNHVTAACPDGYTCGPDDRCYKDGQVPDASILACADDDRTCDGLTQLKCTGGVFSSVGVCDKACLEGFCVECAKDARRCNDNQPQKCNASGGWSDEAACPALTPQCDQGLCVGPCVTNSKRCSPTENAVQQCDQQGVYRALEACTFVCADAACSGECRPGTKRCGPNQTPQTCSPAGAWVSGTACNGVCNADGSCSGECQPAATRCADNKLQTCGATGTWGTGSACTFVCPAGGTSCSGECVPQAKRCNDTTVQQCGPDGRWTDLTACGSVPCTEGECRACNSNDRQCNAGIPQLCAGGVWQNLQPSACPFLCTAGECTGGCVPGSYVCEGNVERSCGQDATYTNTTCPFVCVPATGKCGGSCLPTTKRCSGDVSQTCQADGSYSAGQSCAAGCDEASGACNACVADDVTVTCKNGGCGEKTNNCGNKVTCPLCTKANDSCGGGGVTGVCGCTPTTTCTGKCGMVSNGCDLVNCGACPDGGTTADARLPDAALPDAAIPDAAIPDAALPDAALVDARPPDAAPPVDAMIDAMLSPPIITGIAISADDPDDDLAVRQGIGAITMTVTGSDLASYTAVTLGGLPVTVTGADASGLTLTVQVGHGAVIGPRMLVVTTPGGMDTEMGFSITAITSGGATGNDVTGRGTPSAPLATVKKALSVSGSGDSIQLLAWTFTGEPSYLQAFGVTITGAGRLVTVIDGGATTQFGVELNSATLTKVGLKGFTGQSLILQGSSTASHVTVNQGGVTAVSVQGATSVLDDVKVIGFTSNGIGIGGSGASATLTNLDVSGGTASSTALLINGINAPQVDLSMSNLSGGSRGIGITAGVTLKVRTTTISAANGNGINIVTAETATAAIDLGKAGDAGGNLIYAPSGYALSDERPARDMPDGPIITLRGTKLNDVGYAPGTAATGPAEDLENPGNYKIWNLNNRITW